MTITIEADICTVVSAIVADTFPDQAPTNPSTPYAVYQLIGGNSASFTENTDPPVGGRQQDVSIVVWATTRLQANALMRSVATAMRAATAFTASAISELAHEHEPGDVAEYGARQDFSCWF